MFRGCDAGPVGQHIAKVSAVLLRLLIVKGTVAPIRAPVYPGQFAFFNEHAPPRPAVNSFVFMTWGTLFPGVNGSFFS